MDAELAKRLDRIERKLSALLGEKAKATWVKVAEIRKLTGWNRDKIRRMRVNGIVEFKKTDRGFFYKIESIPELLIKKAAQLVTETA